MPTPTELIQAKITALENLLASGERSVTLDGQTVTYNTTDSLIKAIDKFKGDLAGIQGVRTRPRQAFGYFTGRGYN